MAGADAPSVFDFDELVAFLQAWYEAKKDGAISYRWLARRLDHAHGHVRNIFTGKRPLPVESAARLADALGLDDDETAYFRQLVELSHARTDQQHREARARMLAIRRMRIATRYEGALRRLLDSFAFFAVKEFPRLEGYEPTPEYLQETAAFPLPFTQAEEALEVLNTLMELGPEVDRDGLTTGMAAPGPTVRLHLEVLDLAKRALIEQSPAERSFQGITAAVSEEGYQDLRRTVEDSVARWFERTMSDRGPKTRVLQLNAQIYQLSRKRRG